MINKLNFPEYPFSLREGKAGIEIFDDLRRKFIKLTPEEWVRQHLLRYIIMEKNFPASLIAVEYSLTYNQLKKRCDALVFNVQAKPLVLIECKSEKVELKQNILEQIGRYNFGLNVPYLLISNGLLHYMLACKSTAEGQKMELLSEIPTFDAL
ncbi:MAG: type I restriction enzyme HsdR N-terminal domain-containing protein [Bacteroidota bacterium]